MKRIINFGSKVQENNLQEPFLPEGGYEDSIDGSVDLKYDNSWSHHKAQVEIYRKKQNIDGVFFLDNDLCKFSKTSLGICGCGLGQLSRLRYNLVWLITRNEFNNFILVIIFINSIMMGMKDYLDTENKGLRNQRLEMIEPYINTIIYAECIFKIVAMGFVNGSGSYLRDGWNFLDFVVVMSSVISAVQSYIGGGHAQSKGMQAFRTFRLLRPLRLLGRIETLKTMISTLLSSMSALSATMGLTLFVFTVYAIFGMTVWSGALHYRCYVTEFPVNGEWTMVDGYTDICSDNSPCPTGSFCGNRYEAKKQGYSLNDPNLWVDSLMEEQFWGFNNFDNLGSALLTVFQVTTMDGWTPMMHNYENAGSQALSWFWFISCVVICNFFILNLTVGQMMLSYEQEQEILEEQNFKDNKYDVFSQQLKDYGEEVLDKIPEIKCTSSQKHKREHLETCKNSCRLIEYVIECDELVLSKRADEYVKLDKSMFKSFAEAQKQDLDKNSAYYNNCFVDFCINIIEDIYFNAFIIFVILANTAALCCDKYPEYSQESLMYFEVLNLVFTAVFTFELVIKIIALGIRPFLRDGFNIFDALIVFTSIQAIYVEMQGNGSNSSTMMVLRTFRCFRIFKLFKVGDLRVLVDSQIRTMPQFIPYLCLLVFVFYIFALIGMSFFAGKIRFDDDGNADPNGTPVREGFDNLGMAFLTIFQLLMGAEWRFIWYQNMLACGPLAAFYYVAVIICIVIVMINLLMAIMLGNYDKARKIAEKRKIFQAIEALHKEENTEQEIIQSKYSDKTLKKNKYNIKEICDIVFGDYSNHIKTCILNIEKKTSDNDHVKQFTDKLLAELKKQDDFDLDFQKEEEPEIDEHTHKIQNHDNGFFANSSLGLFHIDGSIRKGCLALSVDNANYNELQLIRTKINARNIQNQINMYLQLLKNGPDNVNLLDKIPDSLTLAQLNAGFNYNKYFERFILLLIIVSSILLAFNDPFMDPESELHQRLWLANVIFTIIFTFELIIRIIAQGFFTNQLFHIDPYFKSGWNRLDFLIVTSSLMDLALEIMLMFNLAAKNSNLEAFKALRSLRALRPLRTIKSVPQLKQVVDAFLSSLGAIQNVFLVGIIFLVIFSVIGINLFKGTMWACDIDEDYIITKADCLDNGGSWTNSMSNFDNIVSAMRTLFILTTTEGWAGMMYLGVDTVGIDMQPKQDANPYMVWYFLTFMIVGSLFVMNLVVGVIIDQFNKAKEQQVTTEDANNMNVKVHMVMVEVNKQKALRSKPLELPSNWTSIFFKFAMHPLFDKFILLVVVLNTITMSMVTYNSTPEYLEFLRLCNLVFTIIFNFEMVVKLIALKSRYFENKWNLFDMFIVVSADLGILLTHLGQSNSVKNAVTVFRVLRILRVAKLLQKFENVQILLNSLILITPNISNVLLVLALIIYIYALVGIYLFAGAVRIEELDKYNNFSSFGRAILALIRYSTGEDFQEFMYELSNTGEQADCRKDQTFYTLQANGFEYEGCGSKMSVPFFFSFTIISGWLVINLIVGAIVDGLAQAQAEHSQLINGDVINAYFEIWERHDPLNEWKMRLRDFWVFFPCLEQPIGEPGIKEPWVPSEGKEGGYFYNETEGEYFKVRMFALFKILKNLSHFKLDKINNSFYVDFFGITKSLINRAYIEDQNKKNILKEIEPDNSKKQLKKSKSSVNKKSQFSLSHKHELKQMEECPMHHLASHIIATRLRQKLKIGGGGNKFHKISQIAMLKKNNQKMF